MVFVYYAYSTSAWGDLLTNYDGTAISYDSVGNPTNWIDISNLVWDGKVLDSITIEENHTVDYTYTSDGLRTRKYEYNGNEYYYYDHSYVLDGSKILKETILYSSAFNGIIQLFLNIIMMNRAYLLSDITARTIIILKIFRATLLV